ncbi:MAG TPA: hypothetical protein VN750_13715, partial [Steroidobacteraceae bacterium]|nr:hypothetical protein [Steroidobacteraceae bacterium]
EYAISLGQWGSLIPRADYTYQSAVFNDSQNELISRQGGYGTLNAHLTWQSMHGGWEASVLISNVTDRMYYLTEQNLLSTYDAVTGQPGRPREFLVSVRKTF